MEAESGKGEARHGVGIHYVCPQAAWVPGREGVTDTQEATCCAGKSIVQEATSVFLTLCPDLLFRASVYTLYEIRHLPCHGYSVATCGRILNRKSREIVQRGTVGTSRTSSAPRPQCTLLFSKSQIEKPALDAHQAPFLLLISTHCRALYSLRLVAGVQPELWQSGKTSRRRKTSSQALMD